MIERAGNKRQVPADLNFSGYSIALATIASSIRLIL